MRDFWLFPFKQKKKAFRLHSLEYHCTNVTVTLVQSCSKLCGLKAFFFFFFFLFFLPPVDAGTLWLGIIFLCLFISCHYLIRDPLLLSFDRSICILKTWASVVCNHVFGIKWIMIGLFFSEWYELDWVTLVAVWNCVVELQRISKPTF